MILSIWQRHRQNNQFCWFLKKELKMENTFVKQMLIFFNLWCFGMISANSNSSQQYSVPYPHFFRILDFQAESFEGLSYSRPDSDIYGVSMSKKFALTFWPSWEGRHMVKMLDFLWRSAKQFSALERGREKPKHVLESPDISRRLVDKNWELTQKAETKITKINFWPKS